MGTIDPSGGEPAAAMRSGGKGLVLGCGHCDFAGHHAMSSRSPVAAPRPPDDLGGLLRATAEGDRDAFERLYQLTSPRLLAVALRVVQERSMAEEVLQEAYLNIWSKARQHGPEQSAIGWMVTVVRHRAIDRLRAESKESERRGGDSSVESIAQSTAVLPSAFDLRPGSRMSHCLEALEPKRRKALLMAYYLGHTQEELSQHLGVPLGTVKSWIRRSLIQLRECLDA